jgi:heptosyltransferase-1
VNILIVKTSSMGDVIHALPLASDIAAAVPGAVIHWAVEDSFAAIPRLHPAVSKVLTVAVRRWRRNLFDRGTWDAVAQARASLREVAYDRIIDCQGLLKSAVIARWAQGPISGPDFRSAREPVASLLYHRGVAVGRTDHALVRNRAIGAAALGYRVEGPPRFGLQAVAGEASGASSSGPPYAVLLTNASRPTKLWPDERWAAVAQWLADQGLHVKLFWGSDAERTATQARAARMPDAQVMPRSPLDAIAATLAGAQLVIGLDTGLTHLAGAVGVPTVGIFCDYDPRLVGIVGDAQCISLGGVDIQPAAHEVIEAAARVRTRRP